MQGEQETMSDTLEKDSSRATQLAAKSFTRRTLLQGAAAAGVLAAAGPFIVRNARAASGELKVFAWSGYISPEMLADFEKKTGIKPALTEYGTNDELLNQLRASGGAGFDVIMPTVDRVPNYVEFDLVQPLDEVQGEVRRLHRQRRQGFRRHGRRGGGQALSGAQRLGHRGDRL